MGILEERVLFFAAGSFLVFSATENMSAWLAIISFIDSLVALRCSCSFCLALASAAVMGSVVYPGRVVKGGLGSRVGTSPAFSNGSESLRAEGSLRSRSAAAEEEEAEAESENEGRRFAVDGTDTEARRATDSGEEEGEGLGRRVVGSSIEDAGGCSSSGMDEDDAQVREMGRPVGWSIEAAETAAPMLAPALVLVLTMKEDESEFKELTEQELPTEEDMLPTDMLPEAWEDPEPCPPELRVACGARERERTRV